MYLYVRSEVASLFHICLNIPLVNHITKFYITSLPILGIQPILKQNTLQSSHHSVTYLILFFKLSHTVAYMK